MSKNHRNGESQAFLKVIQHRPLSCLTAISNTRHIFQVASLITREWAMIKGDTAMRVILDQLSLSDNKD